jgi:hypothetical protein
LLFDKFGLADVWWFMLNLKRKFDVFSISAQTMGVRLSETVAFQATRV